MYSKTISKNKEFKCKIIEFTIEEPSIGYSINDIESICRFVKDSQEEIYSNDDYVFNGISIVGCDLIDYLRRIYG